MNFFLGFFPDDCTKREIQKVTDRLDEIFRGFDIPVRWSVPENYHMSVMDLGNSMPFYKLLYYKYKLKNFKVQAFKVKFGKVKLGISRKYKELIYLDLEDGGEEMRKIFQNLREILKISEESNFVPHLTLGRVSKDLTNQEYSNVSRDLTRVGNDIGVKKILFELSDLCLVGNKDSGYKVLMNLREASSNSI